MNTAPQVVVVDTDTGDDVDDALALALTQTHHSEMTNGASPATYFTALPLVLVSET